MKKILVVTAGLYFTRLKILNLLQSFEVEYTTHSSMNIIKTEKYEARLVLCNDFSRIKGSSKFDIVVIDRGSNIPDEVLEKVLQVVDIYTDKIVNI